MKKFGGIKKVISVLLLVGTTLIPTLLPTQPAKADVLTADPSGWHMKNIKMGDGSNQDVLDFSGKAQFQQYTPRQVVQYADKTTGELRTTGQNMTGWELIAKPPFATIYLDLIVDSSRNQILDMCFSALDANPKLLKNGGAIDYSALGEIKTFIGQSANYALLFDATKTTEYRCFKNPPPQRGVNWSGDSIPFNIDRFLELTAPGSPEYISLIKDIRAHLWQGEDTFRYSRPPILPATVDKCKSSFKGPVFAGGSDARRQYATKMKDAVLDSITKQFATMPASPDDQAKRTEFIKDLTATLEKAVDSMASDTDFNTKDVEMYKKFYSSSTSLAYPDKPVTDNMYMEYLEVQSALEKKISDAKVQLTDAEKIISTGLNIFAGVAVLALAIVATPFAIGVAGESIASLVPAAELGTATVPGSLGALLTSYVTGAGAAVGVSVPAVIGAGLGYGSAGLLASLLGLTVETTFNALAPNGKKATNALYGDGLKDLVALNLAQTYMSANNAYNKCAASVNDPWAVVNDRVIKNALSVMNQAVTSFAGAAIVAITADETVCGMTSWADPILHLGKVLRYNFCYLGMLIHEFAAGLIDGAVHAFEKVTGFVDY